MEEILIATSRGKTLHEEVVVLEGVSAGTTGEDLIVEEALDKPSLWRGIEMNTLVHHLEDLGGTSTKKELLSSIESMLASGDIGPRTLKRQVKDYQKALEAAIYLGYIEVMKNWQR